MFRKQFLAGAVCALCLALATRAFAEDAPKTIDQRVTDAQAAADEGKAAGHNSWMLTSSALVLMMTAPGLALFYSGLVRKKNVLGVMMQCVFLMGLNSVIWALYGYSLSFGGSYDVEKPEVGKESGYCKWVGNFEYVGMKNVASFWNPDAGDKDDSGKPKGAIEVPQEGKIPRLTHFLFQGMFFIITPALICGAFAERMKFSTMVVFTILWSTVVYCPLCHWVWDTGLLAFNEKGNPNAIAGGALDFAGGTVVHISSGVSALICALVIGRRLGFGSEPMPPHNLTYTTIGAAMLWVGWFGFNAGSQLACDNITSVAFAATHLSAAAGTLAWAGMEWLLRGKPTVLGACSGAVAGLVCVTPAAGYVTPVSAMLMGLAVGVVCYVACTSLKSKFKYDDSLDAFGVHGVGGTLGAILTGVFATRGAADPVVSGGKPLGLLDGGSLLGGQLAAAGITIVFAAVVTFILLKILDATMGLRVTQQQEIQGLDFSQHGEEGYIFI